MENCIGVKPASYDPGGMALAETVVRSQDDLLPTSALSLESIDGLLPMNWIWIGGL